MNQVNIFFKNSRALLTKPQLDIFSAALVIAVTYGLSMMLGILRERVLVAKFFACCRQQLDVYYAAFRIPDILFQLIVIGALSAAFIPVFSEYLAKNEKEAYELASSLINLLLIFFLVLSVIIFILAVPFSRLITGNFSDWQINLMALMTRVMLLAQIFFLISNFLSAIAQSHNRFLLPSLAPVVYNIGIIFSVLMFSTKLGIWSATLGILLGSFLHLLIQIPLVFKLGFRFKMVLNFKHPGARKVLKLMFPRTLALAASQIEATISLFLATSLSAGSLTIYYLAQRLGDLPVRLLGTSVGQAALPVLSLQVAQGKNDQFKKTISESLSQIIYLALPVTGFFLVLRVQIVRFAYGARGFPWEATIMTGKTLAAVAVSIFFQSAIQLLVRSFYALHDTRTPFVASIISVIINIGLSFLFVLTFKMGIFGLALAYSIANLINFLLLFSTLNIKGEKFLNKNLFSSWIKMLFAAVVSAFVCWFSMKLLDNFVFMTTRTLPLFFLTVISLIAGTGTYLWLSKLFKFSELQVIWSLGKRLSNWKKNLFSVEEIIEPHSGTGTSF